jgi:hypothetical protein
LKYIGTIIAEFDAKDIALAQSMADVMAGQAVERWPGTEIKAVEVDPEPTP